MANILNPYEIRVLNVVRAFPGITFIGLDAFNIPTWKMRDLADRGLVRKLWIGWEITAGGRIALTDQRKEMNQ